MPEYHVGCGIAGIYAGTLKKNGYDGCCLVLYIGFKSSI